MLRLRRILFPVDFSDRCPATARRVRFLAEHFHSEVIMLYALAPLSAHVAAFDLTSIIPEAIAALKMRAGAELDAFLRSEFSGLDVRRILTEGDPAETIVQHAHALHAGLIMMPTHDLGPFRRYIIGSVTAKVLHDADCPVWTGVHREEAPPSSALFRHVLCTVDLGPQSVNALAWAAGLADHLNARLTLLHVAPQCDPDRPLSAFDQIHKQLDSIQTAAGARSAVRVEIGEPVQQVVRSAAALHAGLLIIGRGAQEGLIGRLRANAYAIVTLSPCPVVSV